MVKPLSFKGDKKVNKRKRTDDGAAEPGPSGELARAEEDPNNDDSWVSAENLAEIVGPVMFVLPTSPATCLACDANGKIFTDTIVNIIDANPASAEPHDARQVWVANKIAGTENFRFKARHGKHLSCDQYGILSATSEAISPLETWKVIPAADDSTGIFQLQTTRSTYLIAKEPSKATGSPEVRGDATETGLDTSVRIRMQARFKPKFKATKEEKAREKISRRELEDAAGRRLEEDEVKILKKARREGDYHEQLLQIKVKNKHDKYG